MTTTTYFQILKPVAIGGGEYKLVPQRPVAELTVTQFAAAAGLHPKTLYGLLQAGRIPGARRPSPKRWLISASGLEEFLAQTRDPEHWDRAPGKRGDQPQAKPLVATHKKKT